MRWMDAWIDGCRLVDGCVMDRFMKGYVDNHDCGDTSTITITDNDG